MNKYWDNNCLLIEIPTAVSLFSTTSMLTHKEIVLGLPGDIVIEDVSVFVLVGIGVCMGWDF